MQSGNHPTGASRRTSSLHWVAEYLLGRVVDSVWDEATGKPDVFLLERRIQAIETDQRWVVEYRASIDQLLSSITTDTTIDEYRELVRGVVGQIQDIDRRLGIAEQQIADHEQRISQLEAYSYSAQANVFPPYIAQRTFQGVYVVGVAQMDYPFGLVWFDDHIRGCRWYHVGGPPVSAVAGSAIWGEIWYDQSTRETILVAPLYGGNAAYYVAR